VHVRKASPAAMGGTAKGKTHGQKKVLRCQSSKGNTAKKKKSTRRGRGPHENLASHSCWEERVGGGKGTSEEKNYTRLNSTG